MSFLPYNILAEEAYHLINKAASCPSYNSNYYWEMYVLLLEKFGWTDFSFDKECLRRIDLYWNLLHEGKVIPIRSTIKL